MLTVAVVQHRPQGASSLETAPRRNDLSQSSAEPNGLAEAPPPVYRIIVHDLVIPWRIGVRAHEEERRQRVRLNLELMVRVQQDPAADDYQEVICYDTIVERIRSMANSGHVKLAETVAHNVAMMCLEDPRSEAITVHVEKLEAIHDAASVGVKIHRSRVDLSAKSATPTLLSANNE
jgi:dihydroneopterin aldolase